MIFLITNETASLSVLVFTFPIVRRDFLFSFSLISPQMVILINWCPSNCGTSFHFLFQHQEQKAKVPYGHACRVSALRPG